MPSPKTRKTTKTESGATRKKHPPLDEVVAVFLPSHPGKITFVARELAVRLLQQRLAERHGTGPARGIRLTKPIPNAMRFGRLGPTASRCPGPSLSEACVMGSPEALLIRDSWKTRAAPITSVEALEVRPWNPHPLRPIR
jgi:hypothetical protein